MPDYMSPELIAACHRASARVRYPVPPEADAYYVLKYRTVSGWHVTGKFSSAARAEDYRLDHFPSVCEWVVLKRY